jgi:hypothetical protein
MSDLVGLKGARLVPKPKDTPSIVGVADVLKQFFVESRHVEGTAKDQSQVSVQVERRQEAQVSRRITPNRKGDSKQGVAIDLGGVA